jgi:hypothetical protein
LTASIVQFYRQVLMHVPKGYFYLINLLIGAVAVMIVCPATEDIGWHLANGSSTNLRGAEFTLPLVWSAPRSFALLPDGIILERKSWFVFRTPAVNDLTLWAPNKKYDYGIEDVMQSMKQEGQSLSKNIKVVRGRQYDCVSRPLPRERFSAFHPAPQIYAYCEEAGTGWKLTYDGSPEILEEGLEIVASRKE